METMRFWQQFKNLSSWADNGHNLIDNNDESITDKKFSLQGLKGDT